MTGKLFVVATPIGNLEDITLRAVRVLRESERVLAEDTRRTKQLLNHLGIDTKLVSLHAHTGESKLEALADELAQGKQYALVTDAGTPLVSDPGFELVQRAIARNVVVEAVPGASAVITALCVSGLAVDHFRFVGFLPRSGKKRREALTRMAESSEATVMFEAPTRIVDTLSDLLEACGGERQAAVCRELTKLHEETVRGTLVELTAKYVEAARGEITVVVEGARESQLEVSVGEPQPLDVDALLAARLASGLGVREVAKELAAATGIDRREAYRRVLEHRAKPTSE